MLEDPSRTNRIAELEADNRRLRQLLEQRDAPGELRHRLRATMALLRTIIRRTADTEREFDAYVDHVEDRMDALMRAQAMVDERGSIDLHDLIAEELHHYGVAESEGASLSGPGVDLPPRTGQVLAMAVHELAINAVEHGQLDNPAGRVEVAWEVSTDDCPTLTLVWKERGETERPADTGDGFGTEVLKQMLGYELKARTTLSFEADGLRCTIRFPLLDR